MFSQPASHTVDPLQALQAALRTSGGASPARQRLLVAGAAGVLGNEVLQRLVASGRYVKAELLASEPMTTGLSMVGIAQASTAPVNEWPARLAAADVGLVMFEPPRTHNERERALWTPTPEQLLPLARWLKACGVQTLVVVTPHAPGRLPDALKRGLANLDEHALTTLGFERLLFVRSARKVVPDVSKGFLEKTAAWMLSIVKYMIPASEQPVRPTKLAEFIDEAMRVLPPGTHVAAPELLWQAGQSSNVGQQAGQGNMQKLVQAWLDGR